MSLAKLHHIKAVRKPGTCGKCGMAIMKGDGAIRFTVGYRGFQQVRCTKSECFPMPSERESSLVADVYAAQEGVDFGSANSRDEIESAIQDVQDALDNVISEYESNVMYDSNSDLQDRVSMLEGARDDLEIWDQSIEDEPEEEDPDTWEHNGEKYDDFPSAHGEWLESARAAAQDAVNNMEIP